MPSFDQAKEQRGDDAEIIDVVMDLSQLVANAGVCR